MAEKRIGQKQLKIYNTTLYKEEVKTTNSYGKQLLKLNALVYFT